MRNFNYCLNKQFLYFRSVIFHFVKVMYFPQGNLLSLLQKNKHKKHFKEISNKLFETYSKMYLFQPHTSLSLLKNMQIKSFTERQTQQ